MTTGGNLKARYVIHTAGPIWHGGSGNEAALLRSAYYECLKVATENKLASVSFPSISTGAYGYPVNEAAEVAMGTVVSFLEEQATSLEKVVFVLFDSLTYQSYCSALRTYLNRAEG
jgi:O-acetyl-ADP-ribose deacetylase (regulator of RNase III)